MIVDYRNVNHAHSGIDTEGLTDLIHKAPRNMFKSLFRLVLEAEPTAIIWLFCMKR